MQRKPADVVADNNMFGPSPVFLVDKNNNLLAQGAEQQGYIALLSPPAQTNAGSETVLTFSQQVNNVTIQNNTSANVNYAFDITASAGSLVLAPNATAAYTKQCTALHLYTAAAQNVNGTSAGNIVVLGAL